METANGLHLLLAYGLGFLSAIVCIIPPPPCNRGYQPKRPSKADIEKTNKVLAHAKPQKSGVRKTPDYTIAPNGFVRPLNPVQNPNDILMHLKPLK